MIKNLETGRFVGPIHDLKDFWYNLRGTSGTWMAISPDEIIPEKYRKYIQEDEAVRKVNRIEPNWIMLKISSRDNLFRSLSQAIKSDIISIPRTKYIREIDRSYQTYWCIASKDLGYPEIKCPEFLSQNYPWIDNSGDWSLFCYGSTFIEQARQDFIASLPDDVTYEKL